MGMDYAERARALVGTRFRLQGRGIGGLDCVGLVTATFGIEPSDVRRNYSLRGIDRAELEAELSARFRRVPSRSIMSGDVLLMSLDTDRFHLGIRTETGFVHAHAGIGRVVETPGFPEWP